MGYIINPYTYATGGGFENKYSMAFDGVNDMVNCGADPTLQPTTGITLSKTD